MIVSQSNLIVSKTQSASSLPPISLSLEDLISSVVPFVQLAEEKKRRIKSEAERVAKEKEEIAEDRRRLSAKDACGLTRAQRESLRAKILKWEAEHEWEPIAFLAFEQTDVCTCGYSVAHLIGVYQHQRRRSKTVEQRLVVWAPEQATDPQLPRAIRRIERLVSVCPNCMFDNGFVGSHELPEIIEEVMAPVAKTDDSAKILAKLKIELREAQRTISALETDCQFLRAEGTSLRRDIASLKSVLNSAKRFIRRGEKIGRLLTKKDLVELSEAYESIQEVN